MTCEDEQVFLERHFETLQRASDGPTRQGTGASVAARPSVVGPLGVSSATMDLMRVGADKDGDGTTRTARIIDEKMLNKASPPPKKKRNLYLKSWHESTIDLDFFHTFCRDPILYKQTQLS